MTKSRDDTGRGRQGMPRATLQNWRSDTRARTRNVPTQRAALPQAELGSLVDPNELALRILFVDDEVQLLRALERRIRSPLVETRTASSAQQAARLVETEPFDVIFSDYRMPGGDGISFLADAARLQPAAERVLMTAFADVSTSMRAINEAGVARFLDKPVTSAEIEGVLGDLREDIRLRVESDALERRVRLQNLDLKRLNLHLDRLVQGRTGALLAGLLSALEYRDTETQWHSRRVALYTVAMAQRLSIEANDLEEIERGALLHDIGKIGVPDAIMLKPGKLTEEEWEVMRTHPSLGSQLLGGIEFLTAARKIVIEHHERWDGRGYPNGIARDGISIGARIFAIADTLDAMTSDRPYRAALPFAVAREEILRNAGAQFDPEVVRVFSSISEAHWRAALRMGQAKERNEEPSESTVRVWLESPFARAAERASDVSSWLSQETAPRPTQIRRRALR